MTLILIHDDLSLAGDRPVKTTVTPFGPAQFGEIAAGAGKLVLLNRTSTDPRAVAYAARDLGGTRVVAVVECAGVVTPVQPVDFVEFTAGRPTTFFSHIGTGYVQQSPPFCPELTEALTGVGVASGGPLLVQEGLPAAAVTAWWATEGVTLITTAGQPEGALCRELELCFAIVAGAAESPLPFWQQLAAALPERGCDCEQSMALARRSGRLDPDWRRWWTTEAET